MEINDFLEKIVIIGVFFLAIAIGVGIAALVIEAVKQTKIEACFDYKDPKICEEVVNEIKR